MDISEGSLREPLEDFKVVLKELASFSDELAAKPMIVVANKMDAAQDPARVKSLQAAAKERRKLPFFKISGGDG